LKNPRLVRAVLDDLDAVRHNRVIHLHLGLAFLAVGLPPAHLVVRRLSVAIDETRVTEIQEALAKRGYLTELPTGSWDQFTYEAMRRFQTEHKVDVTGYPTAHSLKLLGLTSW
jgi:hypothetical protein